VMISHVARRLLRAHVVRRAEREARLREAPRASGAHRERDPEVRHHRLSVVHEHVRRLDVAVNHTTPVRLVERLRHGRRDPDGLVHRKLMLPEKVALPLAG